ncbi:type III effector polygalacturonase Pgl precursor [Granulicella rosea]|uniref:Type III effector polygalacturonase Pgl n=1 Tax=Granulicella rosea TaxID=474952 RepID=A0A239ENJ3_9BACT|nr:glycosyl hydrolase family 28 protein [Granulicella rosea]SNS45502.1 type III effector polygalacturonase Pgl precursor [Granulicella rosea]
MKTALQVSAVLLLCSGGALPAQDTRTVSEPRIPNVCVKLDARLKAPLEDADESKLDTDRIQKAMDGCKPHEAVELASGDGKNAFLTGPLELRPGVTLLIDKGATLFGSRDPKVYELESGSCGIITSDSKKGCKPLITANQASGSGIMGDGVIDGRGGAKMLGKSESWWGLGHDKKDEGGNQQVPRMIQTEKSDDFTLYRITLKNSPNFHVSYSHGDGFTVWGVKIDTPENASNTDGIDPGGSKNITITQTYIRDGDDNIAIKGGNGPATNMTIVHNHFYYGHGMSIGSETNAGVSKILVKDLSLDGTTAGIRIKSNPTRGGLVEDIRYDDICIRNSKNPIQLDTSYFLPGKEQNALPVYQNILLHNVRITGGRTISLLGYDHTHRITITFDGVLILDNPTSYKFGARHADIILGPGPVNFQMTGEDSRSGGKPGGGSLPSCADKFVPFPTD